MLIGILEQHQITMMIYGTQLQIYIVIQIIPILKKILEVQLQKTLGPTPFLEVKL